MEGRLEGDAKGGGEYQGGCFCCGRELTIRGWRSVAREEEAEGKGTEGGGVIRGGRGRAGPGRRGPLKEEERLRPLETRGQRACPPLPLGGGRALRKRMVGGPCGPLAVGVEGAASRRAGDSRRAGLWGTPGSRLRGGGLSRGGLRTVLRRRRPSIKHSSRRGVDGRRPKGPELLRYKFACLSRVQCAPSAPLNRSALSAQTRRGGDGEDSSSRDLPLRAWVLSLGCTGRSPVREALHSAEGTRRCRLRRKRTRCARAATPTPQRPPCLACSRGSARLRVILPGASVLSSLQTTRTTWGLPLAPASELSPRGTRKIWMQIARTQTSEMPTASASCQS